MKQSVFTVFDVVLIVLAIFGVIWVLEQIAAARAFEPRSAPVIYVTVNMPETKPKELTTGDHVKGIVKIGWDKLVENFVYLFLPSWK
jgi:hypothetical protein